jgi:UDP-N-acetylmuramoyl-L-alanyl-D-glutamate--2,6-diaminopimelate ligase
MMAAAIAAMTLGELLGPAAGAHAALSVTALVSDSRQVTPGAAFLALAGESTHGLRHAGEALAAGAVIVLFENGENARPEVVPSLAVPGLRNRLGELGRRFYGRGTSVRELIGVTGTNGKTTVAYLIAQASTKLGRSCGYFGTLGFGLPGTLVEHALTTPDCLTLHRELAEIEAEAAAVEVSSHALAQDRVAGLKFSVAAFTNLSRDHLDWHATMEGYFEAKARLFAQTSLRAAVVNVAGEHGARLLARLAPTVRPITALLRGAHLPGAMRASAAWPVEPTLVGDLEGQGLAGVSVRIGGEHGEALLVSPLIGDFNAENLLVALGALIASGHDLDRAVAALAECEPPPGRMEVFGGGPGQAWVVVDYAHTPEALERVLGELATLAPGEITCVFGAGGQRDRGKRSPMGRAAAAFAAHIVLTDDNPRGEDPAAIVAEIAAGAAGHPDLRVLHARESAIDSAIRAARSGDVVLIAGKGHERTQIVAGRRRDLDDRAVVRSVLGSST